jgi:predicted amidohydrolase YtcJ
VTTPTDMRGEPVIIGRLTEHANQQGPAASGDAPPDPARGRQSGRPRALHSPNAVTLMAAWAERYSLGLMSARDYYEALRTVAKEER